MLGLFDWTPKFVRRYADLKAVVAEAAAGYARDVRGRLFPAAAETYALKRAAEPKQRPRVEGGCGEG
jgi:3-methyl-2-oxobutanoate hydroxymethyltransferase